VKYLNLILFSLLMIGPAYAGLEGVMPEYDKVVIKQLEKEKIDLVVLAGFMRLLSSYFVKKYTARSGKSIEQVPAEVLRRLQAYSWPGNVRELENIIERAVIISTGTELQLGDWLADKPPQNELHDATLEEVERNHIINVLKKTGWRVSGVKGAANILGMKAPTLVSRMRKLNIHRNNG